MLETVRDAIRSVCGDVLTPVVMRGMMDKIADVGYRPVRSLQPSERRECLRIASTTLRIHAPSRDLSSRLVTRLTHRLDPVAAAARRSSPPPRSAHWRPPTPPVSSRAGGPISAPASSSQAFAQQVLNATVQTSHDVVHVRSDVLQTAAGLGFGRVGAVKLATCVSELARNIVLYAGKGEISVYELKTTGKNGLRIVASDEGPGIADVDAVLAPDFKSTRGLGKGLKAVRALADKFEIRSSPRGTEVLLTKWAS